MTYTDLTCLIGLKEEVNHLRHISIRVVQQLRKKMDNEYQKAPSTEQYKLKAKPIIEQLSGHTLNEIDNILLEVQHYFRSKPIT